jgi:hypothetical protein
MFGLGRSVVLRLLSEVVEGVVLVVLEIDVEDVVLLLPSSQVLAM